MATNQYIQNTRSGLRYVSNEAEPSPFYLQEPAWRSDKDCQRCKQCNTSFSLTKRRHHCRRCGECYCDRCTSNKLELARMRFVDPVRHCNACAKQSSQEKPFFEHQLKELCRGAMLNVRKRTVPTENALPTLSSTSSTGPITPLLNESHCRLTPDHQWLQLVANRSSGSPVTDGLHEAVRICDVSAWQLSFSTSKAPTNRCCCRLNNFDSFFLHPASLSVLKLSKSTNHLRKSRLKQVIEWTNNNNNNNSPADKRPASPVTLELRHSSTKPDEIFRLSARLAVSPNAGDFNAYQTAIRWLDAFAVGLRLLAIDEADFESF